MPQTVLDWLSSRYPEAKRQTLKRMVEAGRVTVGGRPARRLKEDLPDGADIRVDERPAAKPKADGVKPKADGVKPKADGAKPRAAAAKLTTAAAKLASAAAKLASAARRLAFEVVFEDRDVLVVNKPAGLLTSTVPREPRPTLLAAVREYVSANDPAARLGLIHRLDRDAAGLLVFSKSDAAYKSLKTQFFVHSVTRAYTAVVHGVPTPRKGTVDTRLVERADGTVYSTRAHGKGERAVTAYEVASEEKGRSVLRVTLRTGRKHQIRVHLAERAAPIVGDAVYGQPDPNGLHLCATTLAFDHPITGERVTFEVPPPPSFGLEGAKWS